MKTTDKIIIIDLEATCWQSAVPQGQENEIIEIGLAVLDSETGEITQNQGILIRPERSSVSPFCTELTTITPDLLDKNGVSFEEAIEKLVAEYNPDLYIPGQVTVSTISICLENNVNHSEFHILCPTNILM